MNVLQTLQRLISHSISGKAFSKSLMIYNHFPVFLSVDASTLINTFHNYNEAAEAGVDEFQKTHFHNMPWDTKGPFYAGTVTPVLHYCMGGLRIDRSGNVLNKNGSVIVGLHAAGEIVGGVHGKTRLGGNALTECVVFGQIIGEGIEINTKQKSEVIEEGHEQTGEVASEKFITREELAKHKDTQDCWVAIEGKVYDFASFIEEHPGGPDAVAQLKGSDGTHAFKEVHTIEMLADFDDKVVGLLENSEN